MLDKLWALGLAVLTLCCLIGCPPRESGGGGGPASARPSAVGDLEGDQLTFTRAYARVPWVIAHLGAGDWSTALREVASIQDGIVSLKRSSALRAKPRTAIAGLQPKTDQLAMLIQHRDEAAMPLAAELMDDFTEVAVALSHNGWMAATWGGGAGRAMPGGTAAPPPGR